MKPIHSESTLKSWSKADLIEHIICLEHNLVTISESMNNSSNAFIDIMNKVTELEGKRRIEK